MSKADLEFTGIPGRGFMQLYKEAEARKLLGYATGGFCEILVWNNKIIGMFYRPGEEMEASGTLVEYAEEHHLPIVCVIPALPLKLTPTPKDNAELQKLLSELREADEFEKATSADFEYCQ